MNRIFRKAQGKSCSCRTGKICTSCKKKKVIDPVVYIEEPRRLPASIVISRCSENINKLNRKDENKTKHNKLLAEEKKKVKKLDKLYSEEEKRINKQRQRDEKKLKKEQPPKTQTSRRPSLRSWYRQRKALKQLERDYRKESSEKEKERQQQEIQALEAIAKAGRKEKRRKVKERNITAKPRAYSKHVNARYALKTNKTLTYRFVNFCNRLFCQCYCYLTIIFLIGLIVFNLF